MPTRPTNSTLVLIATDARDALEWQDEYPELAFVVQIVFIDGFEYGGLLGRPVTTAYTTESARKHRKFPLVERLVMLAMNRTELPRRIIAGGDA